MDGFNIIASVSIILLDENISNPGCIKVSNRIRQYLPKIQIIIFTELEKGISGLNIVLESQASGYLDHHVDPVILSGILREMKEGDLFIAPLLARKLVEELFRVKTASAKKMDYSFTKREEEVLLKIADGLSNREVADTLFISENTVKAHLTRILQKTNLQNRRQIILAMSKGIINLGACPTNKV
jgi:DNA-binding NarL/FixJ family response regulator